MTLRLGEVGDIRRMFEQMHNEQRRIMKSVIELVYFMRGSIQYDDMMKRSLIERDLITEFLNDRLEIEAKKMHPNY